MTQHSGDDGRNARVVVAVPRRVIEFPTDYPSVRTGYFLENHPEIKAMIKDKPLPKDINSLLPEAFAYLEKRPDIVFAYLFGGLARGKQSPLSDVDIAVYSGRESWESGNLRKLRFSAT